MYLCEAMVNLRVLHRLIRRRPMTVLPVVALFLAVFAAGCASMGRPEGGPRDVEPPVFVSGNPAPGAINVKANKIRLTFDENVDLKNVQQTVIVSPAQRRQPIISSIGRTITVELRDTMRDSTSYTIDFGNAIADLNEGNQLDGFAYAFSTGPIIDTLSISGMVFEARTLEPAQGMLVGVYNANEPDSAIATLPFERVTRTNQLGQFTVRNLAPGAYRVYALNDMNGDYHWDRSEDVAFYDMEVTPAAESTTHTDTLTAADGSDSIVTVSSTIFLPNDILLTWFNENYTPAYMTKYERPADNRLSLLFNAPTDSMPELKIVAPSGSLAALDGRPSAEWAAIDASPGHDSIDVWITDSAVIRCDSLLVSARYVMTDTLDNLVWVTDTVKMFMRNSGKKKKETKAAPQKKSEEADGDSVVADIPEVPKMNITVVGGKTQQLNQPLRLLIDRPLAVFDSTAVVLEMKSENDSLWEKVPRFTLRHSDSGRLLELMGSPVEWESGASYRMTIDSAALVSAYGEVLPKTISEFKARNADEYSAIIFNITGTEGKPAIVELLNKNDEPVANATVTDGRAELHYLDPSTYYARLFFDSNGNGIYDTGSLLDSIQPEETYYFPKKIPVKKNWDVEQTWDIYELTVDTQKPVDIKKNKPKLKAGEQPLNNEDEEESLYDEFGRPINGANVNIYTNTFDTKTNKNARGGRFQNAR